MGKNGAKRYSDGTVDIFALVALDSREIGYLSAAKVKQTMIFRSPFLEGEYRDEKFAERNARIKDLRASGMTFRQIGKEVGIDPAHAKRVVDSTGKSYRYLRDFLFSDAAKDAGFLYGPSR